MGKTIQSGVWPVMITPFTDDNKIDYDGVLRMIEWYDHQGVAGLFAVCQSSEMFFLDRDERVKLSRFVVENTPKHMGVIASGHVAEKVEDQIEDAKAIIDTGIEAYVLISNKFAAPDESEDTAKKNIEYIIDRIPAESLGVYECPYPYKRKLSPELLRWCAETGRFSFLKDTCCSAVELQAKIDAVRGTNLKIFNANAATLLDSLRMGGAGYSGVMANFHADLYVWLCAHFAEDPQKANEVQDLLGAASLIECQVYPINAKYHMALEGLGITLNSRSGKKELLTESRKLEVEQFRRSMELYRKSCIVQTAD